MLGRVHMSSGQMCCGKTCACLHPRSDRDVIGHYHVTRKRRTFSVLYEYGRVVVSSGYTILPQVIQQSRYLLLIMCKQIN